MFGKTITIFCRKGSTWYPRVLKDVQIAEDRGYIERVFGSTSNDTVAVHAKYRGNELIEGKYQYVEPKAWNTLASVDGKISIKGGTEYDFMWTGDWGMVDDTLSSISDSSYPKGFFAYMKATYDRVWAVSAVSVFRTIPHFEIAGR